VGVAGLFLPTVQMYRAYVAYEHIHLSVGTCARIGSGNQLLLHTHVFGNGPWQCKLILIARSSKAILVARHPSVIAGICI
jgi:hypothetical protein